MLNFFLIFLSLMGVAMSHPGATTNCPVLPSGKCWVDCQKAVHEIICEETHWTELHDDLKNYAKKTETKGNLVELIIWNSPKMVNVDANLLSPILDVLMSVALQNLTNLRFFPMLRDATKLEDILLDHCEKVAELDLSHLPESIKVIRLVHTGISRLEFVSETNLKFPNLTNFNFEKTNLSSISGGFFKSFPALNSLHFQENRLQFDNVDFDTFVTEKPLNIFQFSSNNLEAMTPSLNTALFRSVLASLNLINGGFVDLSNNAFRIDQSSMANISRLAPAASLSFRQNHFLAPIHAAGLFSSLVNLKTLDIGNSDFPASSSSFQDLPNLDNLRMDWNYLHDLVNVDMWAGSQSQRLRVLELEWNNLEKMPAGTLPLRSNTIERMNLAGNNIRFPEIATNAQPISFLPYPKLKVLNLESMGLTSFTSKLVQPLTSLTELDISCNPFEVVTKEFFTFFANDLSMLTMNSCFFGSQSDAVSLVIAEDAFSTIRSVTALRLNNGFLREGIFAKLNRMPKTSKLALRSLSLDGNGIRYFNPASLDFTGFDQLQYLSLKNNQIQTLKFFDSSEKSWKNLVTLDLSENLLTVLREGNFRGLENLKNLYLGGNKLIRLADGCLDSLKFLETLLLQDNNLRQLPRFFSDENAQSTLQILGLERNPLEKIEKNSISSLKNLKKLYLHETKVQFLQDGIFNSMNESNGHVISFPRDSLSCTCSNVWIKNYINRLDFLHFVTVVVENPGDPNHHVTVGHVPKCRHKNGSFSFITENFTCIQ